MSLALKALLGALAVVVIQLFSQSRWFYLAGLVPLFPTFALISHYLVGSQRGPLDLRTTALFGLFALIPYAVYLLGVLFLSTRLSLIWTLGLSSLLWVVAAAILILLWPLIVGT
ncbi:GlpM family protein [Suttonella sp. R2A3]|nr:GlpM family protein [Suttonella sp. R2A3]UJF24469.1 GlpM family protein [Suttonella sp. R2A3]